MNTRVNGERGEPGRVAYATAGITPMARSGIAIIPSCLRLLLLLAPLMALFAGPRPSAAAADPAAIWDLVHHHHIHGLPYGQTADLGPEAVPFLLPMLQDPAEEEWWSNVVIALGIVGGGEVTQPLIDFFERWGRQEVTKETYYAATSVPAALGFVAAKGDDAALEYVKSCTRTSFYKGKGLNWSAPQVPSEELQVLLVQIAIKGLGYSARPEAVTHLLRMKARPESAILARVLEPDIQEAIEINQQIATGGPRSHFTE